MERGFDLRFLFLFFAPLINANACFVLCAQTRGCKFEGEILPLMACQNA